MPYQLAQLNLAPALGPREDPRMRGFYEGLDLINGLADGFEGFVWRLQDESGDSTGMQAFPDPTVLVTMSVWKDLEALRQFVYKSTHVDFLRRRHEWFRRSDGPNLVLWWIPEGHKPTLGEGKERLDLLVSDGPTPQAFTFGMPFSAPDEE